MAVSNPPKAPTDQLRLECFKMLSRLQLILEFRPWLEYTRDHIPRRVDSPFLLLWDCFSFGAPLSTLLELLGSPTPRHMVVSAEYFDFNLSMDDRKEFFVNFIDRVHVLEEQGRLSYGEVVRVDDFTSGGFAKVIHAANRIIVALQASFPGLFVVPRGSPARRLSLVNQLMEAERSHVSRLALVADAASLLYEQMDAMDASLEVFIVNCSRLMPYHDHVLQSLTGAKDAGQEQWEEVFAFTNKLFRTKIIASYRSICANYLGFMAFLKHVKAKSVHAEHAGDIINNLSSILSRISEYSILLKAILDVTSPDNPSSYDSLCAMAFEMHDISDSIEEVGRSAKLFPNAEALGAVILDDHLMGDPATGLHFSVFLYETMMFCCVEKGLSGNGGTHTLYPIKPWELGPALSHNTQLAVSFVIRTASLKTLHCIDTAFFEITWSHSPTEDRSVIFYPMMPLQYTQWTSQLEMFVSRVYHSTSIPVDTRAGAEGDNFSVLSSAMSLIVTGDETILGRRRSTARPWSMIGRKGPRSDSSSVIQKGDQISILSPTLLPTLFTNSSATSKSPTRSGFSVDIPPLTPLLATFFSETDETVPNLTGKIVREGQYPIAHGGYSDIWKGVLQQDDSRELKVAVKVLRNTTSDPVLKAKLVERLNRELNIWKRLSHPRILELCGTVSNFGPYTSMVCPWMENGSVSQYMEKAGDLLCIAERLRLIDEVADGLSYLHKCSVIHGDLTGASCIVL